MKWEQVLIIPVPAGDNKLQNKASNRLPAAKATHYVLHEFMCEQHTAGK
jgi:hypothetical protein